MTTPLASRVGPHNSLGDIAGLSVGHHARTGDGHLTGTTVVLAPDGGMVGGVDVRGGGPGTRETDLLHPTAAVERIHAVTLTGGSAYGLAAASGVADALGTAGIGLPVGPGPGEVVPIVPAAVLFDLGRGGDFGARPDERFGAAAVAAALPAGQAGQLGAIGAATGAVAGGLKGGLGTASAVLPDGTAVAALVAVNSVGSTIDPATGLLWASPLLRAEDEIPVVEVAAPARAELAAAYRAALTAPLAARGDPSVQNTTIGVVATDATLTKAQCTKLAGVGHDGLARAIHPIHTLFDGDTLFGLATARRGAPDRIGYQLILSAAADVVSRAVARAVWSTTGVATAGGTWRSYREMIAPGDADAAGAAAGR